MGTFSPNTSPTKMKFQRVALVVAFAAAVVQARPGLNGFKFDWQKYLSDTGLGGSFGGSGPFGPTQGGGSGPKQGGAGPFAVGGPKFDLQKFLGGANAFGNNGGDDGEATTAYGGATKATGEDKAAYGAAYGSSKATGEAAGIDWANVVFEEPPYELMDGHQPASGNFEVRYYPKSTWACSTMRSRTYIMASMKGFQNVFAYIQGNNEGNVKIDMTIPVSVHHYGKTNRFSLFSTYDVCFYLPQQYQGEKAPAPLGHRVVLKELGDFEVFVKVYNKIGTPAQIQQQRNQLEADVNAEADHGFVPGSFISNTYTNPMSDDEPRSEVWLYHDE